MASVQVSYPGVYLNEQQAVTHNVTPATTNWLAVLGVFERGPSDEAVLVRSWSDFESQFGGFDANSTLATYALWQFFVNGGTGAWVVRLTTQTPAAAAVLNGVTFTANLSGTASNAWFVNLTFTAAAGTNAATVAYELTQGAAASASPAPSPIETFPELDGSSVEKFVAAFNAASKLVTASAPATGASLATGAVQLGQGTGAVAGTASDVPAMTRLGPLTLAAKSTGTAMNSWSVQLGVAGGAVPNPGYVSLTVSGPDSSGEIAVQEVLSAAADSGKLADYVNANSDYLTADVTGTAAIEAGATAKFSGGGAAGTGTPATPATAAGATVGALALQAQQAGTAANSWTVTLSAAASGKKNLVDYVLTSGTGSSATQVETITDLPMDVFAIAAAIAAGSKNVTVTSPPFTPVALDLFMAGENAVWDLDTEFGNAVNAQLGFPVGDSEGPPPVPLLDQIAPQVFNLMCVPDAAYLPPTAQTSLLENLHGFCKQRQAFLIVDPPPPRDAGNAPVALGGDAPQETIDDVGTSYADLQKLLGQPLLGPDSYCAATYYPWVQIADPANDLLPKLVPPSGTVAGVYATTDDTRGVWKAPAGVSATLVGVTALADITLTDTINGELNPVGINCLRTFHGYQNVVWGARTLAGNDLYATSFKYVAARRLTDFIEQSLKRSLVWAVFEPNGPALWAAIAAAVTSFMNGLAGAGAFDASSGKAFVVKCDATTTSETDMQNGTVNIVIQFEPVGPAEFVVLNVTVGALPAGAAS